MKKKPLVLVVGPSGSGKSTVLKQSAIDLKFETPVSCTTRAMRNGEVNGKDYHFFTNDEFQARIDRGEFAEYAVVHGRMYGTLKSELDRLLDSGSLVIFDIDIQGAKQLKEKYPEAVIVFIAVHNQDVLLSRIRSRASGESEAEIQTRMTTASGEMSQLDEADYIIENRQLYLTIARFVRLICLLIRGRKPSPGQYYDLEPV